MNFCSSHHTPWYPRIQLLSVTAALGYFLSFGAMLPHLQAENFPEREITRALCDNVTSGGIIMGSEAGCPDPVFDPAPIISVVLPSGGSGVLEYLWIFTTGDPKAPMSTWTPIQGSNSPTYDPGPITQTTHYRRCSRRAGCDDYVGETNIVTKWIECCSNVATGGTIGDPQQTCDFLFDPDSLVGIAAPTGGTGNLEFKWYFSLTGSTFDPTNPDWHLIPGAVVEGYNPGVLQQTTYFIRVVRREGCNFYSGSSNVLKISVFGHPEIYYVALQSPTCFGSADGAIDISVENGTAPYQYQWSNSLPSTEDQTGLLADAYSVTVTDANGCQIVEAFTLTQPDLLETSTSASVEACNFANAGTASVQVAGGTQPYAYLWNDPAASKTDTVRGLADDWYFVTVTDANACFTVDSVFVDIPAELSLSFLVSTLRCFGDNDGHIDLTVNGGTSPYQFAWSNILPPTEDQSGLLAGIYSVTVTDVAGCEVSGSATIANPPQLILGLTGISPTCYGYTNGSIDLAADGGTLPYQYNWSHSLPPSEDQAGIEAGTYAVTVTDAHGCLATGDISLTQPDSISTHTSWTAEPCNFTSGGTASVAVSGGTAPYLYQWSDPRNTTSDTVRGLAGGLYYVTVTDAIGCGKVDLVFVDIPGEFTLAATVAALPCFGDSNGSIDLTVNGGTPPYQFAWSNSLPPTEDQTNLSTGTYSVTVTDATGCALTGGFTIDQPDQLQIQVDAVSPTCAGSADGHIDLSVNGGTQPYHFTWSNRLPAVEDQSGLRGGTYKATVTDANGCQESVDATLTNPTVLDISTGWLSEQCNLATLFVTASGGRPPYQFAWDNPANSQTDTLRNQRAGTYRVTITDSGNCVRVDSVVVDLPEALKITYTTSTLACQGDRNGWIDMTVTGGTPPYQFTWANFLPPTEDQTGLLGGVYHVTVTDASQCQTSASITIQDPPALHLSTGWFFEPCNYLTGGTAFVTAQGGTSPYAIQWNDANATTTDTLAGIPGGTYLVTVTDANHCTGTSIVTVFIPVPLEMELTGTPVSCFGGRNGAFDLSVSGGLAPYDFHWDGGIGSTEDAQNLAAGAYHLTLTDANGCEFFNFIEITEPTILEATIDLLPQNCHYVDGITAQAAASGGIPPYRFRWDDPSQTQSDQLITKSSGTYSVIVTDANSCTQISSIDIIVPAELALQVSGTNLNCFEDFSGTATAIASGGVGNFNFIWNDPNLQTTSSATSLAAGTYEVRATDAAGCFISERVTITQPDLLTVSIQGVNAGCDFVGGSAAALVTGGTQPYTYRWDVPFSGNQSSLTQLASGVYHLTVNDANSCSATASVQISNQSNFNIQVFKTDVQCAGQNSGAAWVVATGGRLPYRIQWDDPSGSASDTLRNLPEGQYSVTVVDAEGCPLSVTADIGVVSRLSISLQKLDNSCAGALSGQASVSVANGVAPYRILWSTGTTTATISSLATGTYSVSVSDAAGCSQQATIQVNEPSALTCQPFATSNHGGFAVSRIGASDGEASVNPAGGTGALSILWSTGATTTSIQNLPEGSYSVSVTDANGCQCSGSVTLLAPAEVRGEVWQDLNENGLREPGEAVLHLPNLLVVLTGTDVLGNSVSRPAPVTPGGTYQFLSLQAGTYRLQFPGAPNYRFTWQDVGADDSIDSDAEFATGLTPNFALNLSQAKTFDAGYVRFAGSDGVDVGDFVWDDTDRDGYQDTGERGIRNFEVRLFETLNTNLVATTLTDTLGKYLFLDVQPGRYFIEFNKLKMPAGYQFTGQDKTDDRFDSDADTASGRTVSFVVVAGQADILTFDAGIHIICDNITDGGRIAGDEKLCGPGDPGLIANIILPSGGSGDIEYLWMYGYSSVFTGPGDPNWFMVPNSNSPSLDPAHIDRTTYYIRCSRRAGCDFYAGETNVVKKEVLPLPRAVIVPGIEQTCLQSPLGFSAENAGSGATYFWTFDSGAKPATAGTRVVPAVSWISTGTKSVQLTVTQFGCQAHDTTEIVVVSCAKVLGEIEDFTVENVKNLYAQLGWVTETNDGQTVFFIEKSLDGTTFGTVDLVLGKEIAERKSYQCTDYSAPITGAFYRLKHMDAQGNYEYSKVLQVREAFTGKVKIYPNPAPGTLYIEFAEAQARNSVLLEVYDEKGSLLRTSRFDKSGKLFLIDLAAQDEGALILRVKFGKDEEEVFRVIKTK
jgi:hypothetical protein